MEMTNDFLPIGSIVRLEGGNKKLMITGFCSVADDDQEYVYDYCGCLYPEGIVDSSENYVFDQEDIEEVSFIGYDDEESRNYQKKINETLLEIYGDDEVEEPDEEPVKPLITIESL